MKPRADSAATPVIFTFFQSPRGRVRWYTEMTVRLSGESAVVLHRFQSGASVAAASRTRCLSLFTANARLFTLAPATARSISSASATSNTYELCAVCGQKLQRQPPAPMLSAEIGPLPALEAASTAESASSSCKSGVG